jgi:hypothetical protein
MSQPLRVFLSKPSTLDKVQQDFDSFLTGSLGNRGFEPLTLQQHADPNVSPVEEIGRLMRSCRGAIIMGFSQVRIQEGVFGAGTAAETKLHNVSLATPWNQIESGMALMLELPLLLLCQKTVSGGVFDFDSSDPLVHRVDLEVEAPDLGAFLDSFEDWCQVVSANGTRRTRNDRS